MEELMKTKDLTKFLSLLDLDAYVDACKSKGYDDMDFLRLLNTKEIDEMCNHIGLKEGGTFRQKLHKALSLGRPEPETKLTPNQAQQLLSDILKSALPPAMMSPTMPTQLKRPAPPAEDPAAKKAKLSGRSLVVHESPEALSANLAEAIARASSDAINKTGRFTIAFSGGSLPSIISPGLMMMSNKIDFSKWHLFFTDERCVPLTSDESNYNSLKGTLLDHVPIENVYVMQPEVDPPIAAAVYEAEMKKIFVDNMPTFDLLLLGMGPDGHTCSLFPGHKLLSEDKLWAVPVLDSPKPPQKRITLTLPVLNSANQVLFVCTGASKTEALVDVFSGKSVLPAAMVKGVNGAIFHVDKAAAGALTI